MVSAGGEADGVERGDELTDRDSNTAGSGVDGEELIVESVQFK